MKNKEEEFFDDCQICQAMKAAQGDKREIMLSELRAAFQKAKDNGGVSGGKWFEEKN